MTFETWIAFVVASTAVVLIPGPNIVLTVNYAIRDGRRSGLATVPGVVAGAFVAMSLSLAGAGALLATSAFLFTLLKMAGAVYLLWLAFKLWMAPTENWTAGEEGARQPLRSVFLQSLLVSVLNPKGPVFYVAFVPQFVSASGTIFQQFAILILTFLAIATVNSLFWLVFASSLRDQFRRPWTMKLANRFGATFLGLAGLFTAKASRAA